jgi:hypothetical protein
MSKKVRIYESEIKRATRRGLMENIAGVHEVEKKSVTQYDFDKPGDLEQFNKDLDTADSEKVDVGQDGAQITNEDEKGGTQRLHKFSELKEIKRYTDVSHIQRHHNNILRVVFKNGDVFEGKFE